VSVTDTSPVKERWRAQWAELFTEVVTSGLCTGCAGCVIACPHDVLGYDAGGTWRPFHLEEELGPGDCGHGLRGCTSCTRACPRFRSWETEADTYLFGRERQPEEVAGQCKDIFLARATDPELNEQGQDGGLVSAILVWCLEQGRIDAALVSRVDGDGSGWKAVPSLARSREEVLSAAGSRYTYSANTLAYAEAVAAGAERLALVGMSCQASVPAIMRARKAGKVGRRLDLSIGLLCSKTFDDSIFEELFEARHGLKRSEIAKINIKGVFQIWLRDGSYHEVPLKEGHAWTREGCKACPDFAAEHADIATGGIGAFGDWTLTIVRTDAGREVIDGMIADGVIETRPGDDDPGAIELLRKLSRASRRRWPETAVAAPRLGIPAAKA
jgi:coenzyme F420 hydrogenase subunit beta